MFSLETLLAFTAASLVVLLLPGPGVLYVTARSVVQGRRAGIISAAGLSVGALVHVLAAVIGLSALLVASATAFGIVKLIGAAYLIYLGIRIIFSRSGAATAQPNLIRSSARRLFVDGVVISIFNPKIAVFFLAFLPQFVDPSVGTASYQIIALGLFYAVLAFCTDSAYALLAGTLHGLKRHRIFSGPLPKMVNGGLFIGLGIKAALTERPG